MDDGERVKVSKYLSYVLRHGAEKEGVAMAADGSVAVSDLLRKKRLNGVSVKDIQHIAKTCPKQRFALMSGAGPEGLRIRAAQGHSIKLANDTQLLKPIKDASQYPVVVHGTRASALPAIQREGLSRMRRQHIHFATGLPGDREVKSGMRSSCDTFIYIDLAKCLHDGIPFFISSNNVILTPGISSTGMLPPQYFAKISRRDRS